MSICIENKGIWGLTLARIWPDTYQTSDTGKKKKVSIPFTQPDRKRVEI